MSQLDMIVEMLNAVNRKLDDFSDILNGNGKPGMKTRLDRVEQFVRSAQRHIWLWWGAVATAVTAWLVTWLTGKQ